MKNYQNYIISFLTGLLLISTNACSEVNFGPADPQNQAAGLTPIDIEKGIYKEVFTQNGEIPKVDILVVVDNSGSMAEEQEKLGVRIRSFLGYLDGIDWQIGITTTDVSTGPYGLQGSLLPLEGASGKILTKDHPNHLQVFLDTVTREETDSGCKSDCPSGLEQPLAAMSLAMQRSLSDNQALFRNGADLVVVVLSDEDEMSSGPDNATKPSHVLNTFSSIWGSSKALQVYGIIIKPGDEQCYQEQYQSGGKYGTHVAELVYKTNGVTGSICDADYGNNLKNIGEQVLYLSSKVRLQKTPIPGSVEVTLFPSQPDISWTVEQNDIVFSSPPRDGTTIQVIYTERR